VDHALCQSTADARAAVAAADTTLDPAAKRQRQSNTPNTDMVDTKEVTSRGLQSALSPVSAIVPYIGVGLEVYCAVEPCLMCAMALVHSRISRVVYCVPQVRQMSNAHSYHLCHLWFSVLTAD